MRTVEEGPTSKPPHLVPSACLLLPLFVLDSSDLRPVNGVPLLASSATGFHIVIFKPDFPLSPSPPNSIPPASRSTTRRETITNEAAQRRRYQHDRDDTSDTAGDRRADRTAVRGKKFSVWSAWLLCVATTPTAAAPPSPRPPAPQHPQPQIIGAKEDPPLQQPSNGNRLAPRKSLSGPPPENCSPLSATSSLPHHHASTPFSVTTTPLPCVGSCFVLRGIQPPKASPVRPCAAISSPPPPPPPSARQTTSALCRYRHRNGPVSGWWHVLPHRFEPTRSSVPGVRRSLSTLPPIISLTVLSPRTNQSAVPCVPSSRFHPGLMQARCVDL